MRITDKRIGGFSPEGTGPSGASDRGLDSLFAKRFVCFGSLFFAKQAKRNVSRNGKIAKR
jgi:hypothetical protein